jgi:hypothetical protein
MEMKIKKLIKELRRGNPEEDVVVISHKDDVDYTEDIGISWDDMGVAVIFEMASSKPYLRKQLTNLNGEKNDAL